MLMGDKDMRGVPAGRTNPYRSQAAVMEKAEAILYSVADDIIDDAIIFILTSKSSTPVETLAQ